MVSSDLVVTDTEPSYVIPSSQIVERSSAFRRYFRPIVDLFAEIVWSFKIFDNEARRAYRQTLEGYSIKLAKVEALTKSSSRTNFIEAGRILERITTEANKKGISLSRTQARRIRNKLQSNLPEVDLERRLECHETRLRRIPEYSLPQQRSETNILRRDLQEDIIRAYVFEQNPARLKSMLDKVSLRPY